jgi:hypothetical protein
MSLLRTIILLASVVSAVLAALFFGHGISTREAAAFLTGAFFLLTCMILIFLQVRIGRNP